MKSTMDLNLLRVFITIMRTGSISHSAEILGISTPAVSQSLNRLRSHYNDRLFVRQGRSMQPTLLAENIYDTVHESYDILSQHSQAYQSFDPKHASRTFKIACHQDASSFIAGPLFTSLLEIAPNISIQFDVNHRNDDQREQALKLKKVDFVLTTEPLSDSQYENTLLFEDELFVVHRKDHPRISDTISETAFFQEQHILWRPQSSQITTLEQLSEQALPTRRTVMKVDSIYHALLLCAETDFICCAPMLSIKKVMPLNPQLNASPLPFETQTLPFYLSHHKAHKNDQGSMWLKSFITELSMKINPKSHNRLK